MKKRSSDTLRLQKKARKLQSDTIQSLVDSSLHNVNIRRAELEEVERKSLRAAMIEERTRYCSFVKMLQPVVRDEFDIMSELGHLEEAMLSIATVTKDPSSLPQSTEELILESKGLLSIYPDSPTGCSNSTNETSEKGIGSAGGSSIGSNSINSRKSSVCSMGSPGHQYQRSVSQVSYFIHISILYTMEIYIYNVSFFNFKTNTTTPTNTVPTLSTLVPFSQEIKASDYAQVVSTGINVKTFYIYSNIFMRSSFVISS